MTAGELNGCVIVTGMPGAGKSTITTLAARLLPRAAQVSGDGVNMMVLSGRVGFQGEPAAEARRQGELCKRNISSLANNFVDFDFTALMDTVVANRAELDFLLGLLAPRPVRLVILAPGVEACQYRNAHRDPEDQFEFHGYHDLEADMRRDLSHLGWWFDTSALTPAETAERLVREAAARCAVLTPAARSTTGAGAEPAPPPHPRAG
jgi:energy-coupling factor transporter ATP-binding protein EcfA2